MSFQKLGTWVANSFVGVALVSVCGKRTFIVNVPWTVSPLEEIDFTWPACTSARKEGLNGIVTRGSSDLPGGRTAPTAS